MIDDIFFVVEVRGNIIMPGRKRWKKILVWSATGLLALGIGGVFAANYAIDYFLKSMVSGIELNLDDVVDGGKDLNEGDANAPVNNDDVPSQQADSAVENIKKNSQTNVSNGEDGIKQTEGDAKSDNQNNVEAEVKPNDSENKAASSDSLNEYSANVSTDKMKNIQENVTIKEKAYVSTVLLQNLDISTIKKLQELAKGGLTVADKKEARDILMSKVTPEEYNELVTIGKKYGVSEGRSYNQIKESQGDEQDEEN